MGSEKAPRKSRSLFFLFSRFFRLSLYNKTIIDWRPGHLNGLLMNLLLNLAAAGGERNGE